MVAIHPAKEDARVFNLELRACYALFESIDTPRSLACALLAQSGEWEQYLDLQCDPRYYDSPADFKRDYQATEVLKKNPRLPTSINKSERALQVWREAETQNVNTRQRIDEFLENPHSADPWTLHTVLKAQQIIQSIIGSHPSKADLALAEANMRFGPGATTSVSGVVTQGRKYSNNSLDATPLVVDYRTFCFPENWKRVVTDINIVRGSRLITVPKNAKTDRVICIEPDLNIFVQLGVGALIRRKLLRFGLDLNTQEVNQCLASVGNTLDLATVDLKSASDTISEAVVRLLLPDSWVQLLEFCRSPETRLPDGTWHRLEKWSSMGNGYTFELETLIFYACILAVVPRKEWCVCAAYGDDLILPSAYMADLMRVLAFLGFSTNPDKSFGFGRFRESCGTDWFDGVNVRPFFFRKADVHDFPSVCYSYANTVRRVASDDFLCHFSDPCYRACWDVFHLSVSPSLRYSVPPGNGDAGFQQPLCEARGIRRARNGWAGWFYTARSVDSVRRRVSEPGLLLATLNANGSEWTLGRESLRGRYLRAKTHVLYALAWKDGGVWG